MKDSTNKVFVAPMKPRERLKWEKDVPLKKRRHPDKRLLRRCIPPAAVLLCLTTAALVHPERKTAPVSAGFEYDDTLGRLQFVSNMLPESAMVFLSGDQETQAVLKPVRAEPDHPWAADEPWLEYSSTGQINSCMSGEVMTIVRSRQNEYTVRLMHAGGYESIYSGLNAVNVEENTLIEAGAPVGIADGFAAFELRKDGLSILPVFSHAR